MFTILMTNAMVTMTERQSRASAAPPSTVFSRRLRFPTEMMNFTYPPEGNPLPDQDEILHK
jgi:hypothetical protein